MRKIVVLEFISLDGVIQAPGGPTEDPSGAFQYGGWTAPYFDDESGAEMGKQMAGDYDLLLGRHTYDIFASYWPDHVDNWPQVNQINKYVVSNTLKNPSWQNTIVLKDLSAVAELKKSDGIPLQVYGSSVLAQALLNQGLVDELWLKTFPVTLGKGKHLFNKDTLPAAFKLNYSKVTASGVIFASYSRSGKVKTGSVG